MRSLTSIWLFLNQGWLGSVLYLLLVCLGLLCKTGATSVLLSFSLFVAQGLEPLQSNLFINTGCLLALNVVQEGLYSDSWSQGCNRKTANGYTSVQLKDDNKKLFV